MSYVLSLFEKLVGGPKKIAITVHLLPMHRVNFLEPISMLKWHLPNSLCIRILMDSHFGLIEALL